MPDHNLSLTTVPSALYLHEPPVGPSDLFCFICLPAELPASDAPAKMSWSLENQDGRFRLTAVQEIATPTAANALVPLSMVLPTPDPCTLRVTMSSSGVNYEGKSHVQRFQQPGKFDLPFHGAALVTVGHGLADVHRSARQIVTQQFAWDFVPLSEVGLGLLRGPIKEPLHAEEFAAFGRPVCSPALGRVVQVVDGESDHSIANVFPDREPYLADLLKAPGNYVILDHDGVYSCLAHLMKDSVMVEAGQEVAAGQHVASLGNSGFSSGPHIHLQFMDGPDLIRSNPVPIRLEIEGETIDPQTGRLVTGSAQVI